MTPRSPPAPPATCSRFAPSAEGSCVVALTNDWPKKHPQYMPSTPPTACSTVLDELAKDALHASVFFASLAYLTSHRLRR